MANDRLWVATDRSGGAVYVYGAKPRKNTMGVFIGMPNDKLFGWRSDERPPPGECWEFVRADAVDTASGALAVAKADIERLTAERDNALTERGLCLEAWDRYREKERPLEAEIERLTAELAEAKKMPECVEKLLHIAVEVGCGAWGEFVAAIRAHYATPITLSVGRWRLSDGTEGRVYSDGIAFVICRQETYYTVEAQGRLATLSVCLAERIGD